MNAAVPMSHFNQIKYLDDLQNAGMAEKQARAVISLVNDVSEQHYNDLVTKEHLSNQLELRFAQAEIKAARRFNALLLTVIVSILVPFFVHHFGIS